MAKGAASPTSATRLAAAEKQAKALELKKGGYTFAAIAKQLGYAGESGARKAVRTALEKTVKQPAEEVRLLIQARNEEMMKVVYARAQAGELEAVDRVIKINRETAAINGLISTKVKVGQDPEADPVGIDAMVKVSVTLEVLAQLDTEGLRQFRELRNRLATRIRSGAGGGSDGESGPPVDADNCGSPAG